MAASNNDICVGSNGETIDNAGVSGGSENNETQNTFTLEEMVQNKMNVQCGSKKTKKKWEEHVHRALALTGIRAYPTKFIEDLEAKRKSAQDLLNSDNVIIKIVATFFTLLMIFFMMPIFITGIFLRGGLLALIFSILLILILQYFKKKLRVD